MHRGSSLPSTRALRGQRSVLPTLKFKAFFEQQFNLALLRDRRSCFAISANRDLRLAELSALEFSTTG